MTDLVIIPASGADASYYMQSFVEAGGVELPDIPTAPPGTNLKI